MKVHLRQIPAGGTLHLEGEEDSTPLGLEEAGAEPVGPLEYSLDVGVSEGGLFATGSLVQRVRMTCVSCLEPFERDIVVDPFATQIELEGSELVDLTPEAREDCIFLSSRIVKEVARLGGDVSPFVSPPVLESLKGKFPKA